MRRHPHPLWLFYRLRRYWPLLLVPAVRLWNRRAGESAIVGLGWDGIMALLLVGAALWLWRTSVYTVDDRGVVLRERRWYRSQRRVYLSRVAAVGILRAPLMGLCGARRVWLYAPAGRRAAELSLYLSQQSARQFWPQTDRPHRIRHFWPTLVLAASGSNAAVGLLTAAVPLRQAARLWGGRGAGELVTFADRALAWGLPPVLEAGALLLLLGWGVAFWRNMWHYAGFSAQADGDGVWLRSGIVTRRDIWFSSQEMTALCLRQTLFMRLFGLYSASVRLPGRGKREETRPVLIPAAGRGALVRELFRLLPGEKRVGVVCRPTVEGCRRYLLAPFLWLAASGLPLLFGTLWRPLTGLWLAATFWWLCVRLCGWQTAGVTVTEDYLLLRYPRGLALYTVAIPRQAVEAVELRQSPFQRRRGLCQVVVHTGGGRHRVWSLPQDELRRLWRAESCGRG